MVDQVFWPDKTKKCAYTLTNTWSTQCALGTASRSELAAPQVVFQRRSLQCSNILFCLKNGSYCTETNSLGKGIGVIKGDHRDKQADEISRFGRLRKQGCVQVILCQYFDIVREISDCERLPSPPLDVPLGGEGVQ